MWKAVFHTLFHNFCENLLIFSKSVKRHGYGKVVVMAAKLVAGRVEKIRSQGLKS